MTRPLVLCRVCVAPHDRTPLFACQHCGAVLCPERTERLLTGMHWVVERGQLRVCGRVCRSEVRSDMTTEVVAGRD